VEGARIIKPDQSGSDPINEAPAVLRPPAALILVLVGGVLVASQWVMARHSPAWTQESFRSVGDVLPLVALLGLPALLALAAVPSLERLAASQTAVLLMLATGLAMRLVWYGVPVVIDEDHFRYLWDGAVVAAGSNPYTIAPGAVMAGDPTAAHLATLAAQAGTILRSINFPELTTIYPGAAQLAFALAHYVSPFSIDGLRLVFLGAELAGVAVLVAILKDLRRPPLMAALFWLNPLIVWASHGTVHSEALLAPLLLGACFLAWRGRDVLAAVLLALAVGVKLWPVLLVPLLARLTHARGRSLVVPALVCASVSLVLLAPLAHSAFAGVRSGLVAYSDHWWTNNAPFSWISYGVVLVTGGEAWGQRILRAVIALGLGGLALHVARRAPANLRSMLVAATAVAATTFYLAPAQFPWYALWFLSLAAAVESRPLLLSSATLASYYLLLPLVNQGAGELHNYGLAFLHALPVWAWLAWSYWRPAATPAGLKPRPPSPTAS
jgi:alpha-1,6-mannosyltransferase